ncbi:MAG TPA: ABC transporter permease [Thermomicrobiales bacterium]
MMTSTASNTAESAGLETSPPTQGALATGARKRRGHNRELRLFLWSLPIIVFVLAAIVGPMVVEYDPVKVRTGDRLKPPGAILRDGSRAWLGTDQVGRDMLAQVLQGARISLLVGAATVLFAGLIGLVMGTLAGFYGGFLDALLMRLADIQLAFPSILLAIMIAAVLGPSVANVIITLSLTRWVTFGRVARAATLSAKERDYVIAARSMGAGTPRLLRWHIVPSTIAPLIVIATVEVGLVIIAEASLSFLGLGTPPDQPSWGQTVAHGRDYLNRAWWIATMPGLALSIVVLSVGAFGDRLRDYLDPRMRGA